MKSVLQTGRYRHYKGNDYQVVGSVIHSETEEVLVLYYPLYGEEEAVQYWVRPLAMFTEKIQVNGVEQSRFSYIES